MVSRKKQNPTGEQRGSPPSRGDTNNTNTAPNCEGVSHHRQLGKCWLQLLDRSLVASKFLPPPSLCAMYVFVVRGSPWAAGRNQPWMMCRQRYPCLRKIENRPDACSNCRWRCRSGAHGGVCVDIRLSLSLSRHRRAVSAVMQNKKAAAADRRTNEPGDT